LEANDKILRYIKGTSGKKIIMQNNKSNELYGYTDADWARSFDRKIITGYCTFLDENIVT
jgi:hypothetical protein